MSYRPRFNAPQPFNKKQRTSPTTWKGRATQDTPTDDTSSSQPFCPLCGDGENVKLLTCKKEGPNQGRQFYSCSIHNSFKWADEVEDGQQPQLEANKSKFLDKSKGGGSGQVQKVRDQYTKEFRNPAPFQSPKPGVPQCEVDDELVKLLHDLRNQQEQTERRVKEMSKMVCELYEACQQRQDPPEEDGEVVVKEERKDDSNKENIKPTKNRSD